MRFSSALATVSVVASLTVTSTMAQTTSSTSSSNTTTSSLIPTGISDACTAFMTQLNNDASIQTCTAPLLSATQFYANATSAAEANSTSTSTNSSASALTSSLSQLCQSNTGCDADLIRSYLSQFWTACDTEIRAENAGVLDVYDVLYLINPFHQAVCTKDDSNNYCVLNIATDSAANSVNTSTVSRRSLFTRSDEEPLEKRQTTTGESVNDTASAVDESSLSSSNIAFLFLQTTSDKSVLCSSCAKNILASYIAFETSIPYAIGLGNSDILRGQSALYSTMKSTCGDSFTTSINQVAGTTAFAAVGGAGSLSVKVGITMTIAALAAVVAVL
jgi:hypothetical protein